MIEMSIPTHPMFTCDNDIFHTDKNADDQPVRLSEFVELKLNTEVERSL